MPRPQVIISGRCVRLISSVTKDGVEAIFGLTLTLPEVKFLIERLTFSALEIEQQEEPAPTPPAQAQPGKLLVLPTPKKKQKS